ncbi:adenosylcobinamide-GDP ribazoletransferase [Ectobacillus sp. sgz5001026]|uniref:adenosylcobinamide-GDP ribazoletransferase n=1 Tax=Ectobacillus sp. sgz5001026 TaxID=3242473 RepID=UPI0036D240C8
MKAFLTAVMFLTRIPVPRIQSSKQDWQKSAIYFPIVGLIIGAILSLASFGIERIFSEAVSAFLIVLLWIWVTGGLHIDGWMDLADGFGSNRSREETLEIMKDSRVGAMGVIAGICLIVGKMIAVYELLHLHLPSILVLSPFYARFLLISAIRLLPYRKEGGIGAGLRTYITWLILAIHTLILVGITYLTTGMSGILLFSVTAIITGLFVMKIYKKLNMLTGDCYGALVEFSECVSLFLALAIWRFVA